MGLVRYALRPYALAVSLALGSAITAVLVAAAYDLPLRDPDGIAGPAYVRLPGIAVLFLLADVVPRVVRRSGPWRVRLRRAPLPEHLPQRLSLVAVGLISFYVTYVSYRNLKGALPFVRPRLYDGRLLDVDRAIGFGHDPANLLHDLLGTGLSAHVLSAIYLFFLAFVPLSLGAALVWGRSVRIGSWYVTALCLNWLLGTASYFLVPSLGPVYVRPDDYADLPDTGVTALQQGLDDARTEALADPMAADSISGIAGFASLHCSIVFTAALLAHRIGLPLVVRWAMWAFLVGTVTATAYFGWHYLLDDVAGLALGAFAVWLADLATRHTIVADDPLGATATV